MISIGITALFILAAWRYGDWRNWKQYYPTMLYMIINALLFNIITYEFTTWKWDDITGLFPNHTLLDFWIIFTQFPAAVLLYLTNYPITWKKRLFRLLLWVGIFTVLEVGVLIFDYIKYDNEWHLGWSIFFNVVTFVMLALHYYRPLLTWVLSIAFIIILCTVFGVPLANLR